jgi:outer membrane protein assembly factor BamE (lipoprotein component of BamABCDE complex)
MNNFGSIYIRQKPAILLLFLAAGFTIVFLEVGCSKIPIYKNQNSLLKLQKGMSKGKVLEVMGEPDFHEVYESLYGHTLMIAYYYTHHQKFDGKITKDECTPVVIKNEKLIGWGDDFYQWFQRREKKINHQ